MFLKIFCYFLPLPVSEPVFTGLILIPVDHFFVQCFYTVGWAIVACKNHPQNVLTCVAWDDKVTRSLFWLSTWTVVRTSFFGWQTFPDLYLTCDHFMGKVSTIGHLTRLTQPSIPLGSVNE